MNVIFYYYILFCHKINQHNSQILVLNYHHYFEIFQIIHCLFEFIKHLNQYFRNITFNQINELIYLIIIFNIF